MKIKVSLMTILLGFGLFIWVIVTIGGYYKLTQTNALTKAEINSVIQRDTVKPEELKPVKGAPIAGVKVAEMIVSSEAMIITGGELYKNMCASCHGDKGLGDGAGGASLNPKPRNFTSPDAWKNGTKISQLYKTIEEGIPGSGMQPYEFLNTTDKFALIHFIRKFGTHFQVDTEQEIAAFNDIYDLASDRRGKSQIPLSKAIDKVIADNKPLVKNALLLAEKFEQDISEGAVLLSGYIHCPRKAFTSLAVNGAWRQGADTLFTLISSAPVDNGFSEKVNLLNREKLTAIYNYLLTIM